MKSSKQEDLGDDPQRALGLFKDKNGHYQFAKIDYNPETGGTLFIERLEASRVPNAVHMAKFNFEELIDEEIISKLEEESV